MWYFASWVFYARVSNACQYIRRDVIHRPHDECVPNLYPGHTAARVRGQAERVCISRAGPASHGFMVCLHFYASSNGGHGTIGVFVMETGRHGRACFFFCLLTTLFSKFFLTETGERLAIASRVVTGCSCRCSRVACRHRNLPLHLVCWFATQRTRDGLPEEMMDR